MHKMSCRCAHCRPGGDTSEFETLAFAPGLAQEAYEFESPEGLPPGEPEPQALSAPRGASSGRWTRRGGVIVVEGA